MENPDTSNQLHENDDPTWDLLKHASTTEPSAFFSRNVAREVRHLVATENEKAKSGGLFSWFKSPVGALTGAIAAIAILAVSLAPSGIESGTGNDISVAEVDSDAGSSLSDEFADVEYLGELMAVSDPAMLTDQAFAQLF